jgi:hypothetical protein
MKTDACIDQWNRVEIPEIKPHIYSQWIIDEGTKNIHWRKGSFFNKWSQEHWKYICKRLRPDLCLSPYTYQLAPKDLSVNLKL